MKFYLIFIFVILFQVCSGEVRFNAADIIPFAPANPPTPSKCNKSNLTSVPTKPQSNVLQFRLPFMDMNIKIERNLHIMQEIVKQQIFILHGDELYELIVSGEEKRLSLIGVLAGSVKQQDAIAAKVISWRNYMLLVIALEDFLEIYQLPTIVLAQNAESASLGRVTLDTITKFEPIQQLTIYGRFHKLFLCNSAEDRVILITAENYTKLQSKLRTYEWANTFFDSVEDLTIPAIHFLDVIGTKPKYLLSGRLIKHQSRTIITVFEVDANDLHLRNRQTFTIPVRTIHAFTYRGRNYLLGCTSQQQKCNSYLMKRDEAQFSVYRQFNAKELTFDRFIAGGYFLVGAYQRSVYVYPNGRMDCYASFTANENDVKEIIAHVSQHGESFVLLNYRRTFQTLLRIIEIETMDGQKLAMAAPLALNDTGIEDLSALQQHRHLFESTIRQFKSLLLQRRSAMDTFRNVAAIMRPKIHELNSTNPICLNAGNVGIVRISGRVLQSPIQLMERIRELRAPQRSARITRRVGQTRGFILTVPRVAKIQHLQVGNLLYNGTLLGGFHFENTSSSHEPILTVHSRIRTKVLSTPQLLTRHSSLLAEQSVNTTNVTSFVVRDLNVELINNVSVSTFLDSLFLRNRDSKLKGRLIMQGDIKVNKLHTTLLNNLVVTELFNLKTPQVVHTKLLISSVTVKDMQADLVNGLNFTEDIAFSGRDDIIKGAVEIQHMSISGDLLVDYKPKVKRDIDESDAQFQQFYTGKVIINGSLTVNKLKRDNISRTAVNVSGLPFSESMLKEKYLLKNTPQIIRNPVKFGMAKVTAPQLTTSFLNNHTTMQHLLTTGQTAMGKPLILIFMQAKIDGDIICRDYKSKLQKFSKDAVRFGDTANITGAKTFEALLTVEHLKSAQLNDLHTNELVCKTQLESAFSFFGEKSFDKLIVIGNANIEKSLNTTYLNGERVKSKQDHHFSNLILPHHTRAHNIVINKINGIPINTIFDRLMLENEQLILHKDLLVKGNVEFVDNLQVDTINDIKWNDYVENLVRLNENALIDGCVSFLRGLTITNDLNTAAVNNANLNEVFDNLLLKSKAQQITGNYTFGSLSLTNLDVEIINDIHTNTFIDTRSEEITLGGDFIIPKLTILGNLSGNFMSDFRFEKLGEQLDELKQKRWRNLVVLSNAAWNATSAGETKQYEQLQYLYQHAVRRNADQVITGNVQMTQPVIQRMRTRTKFPADVDVSFIARDCLLKSSTEAQIINARKLFYKPLRLRRAVVEGPLKITILNGIDVERFHAILYRRSSGLPIEGVLCFKIPPFIAEMFVQGSVNGMPTTPIYFTSKAPMPPVTMHSLVVNKDLHIVDINELRLNDLLTKRIRLDGEPQVVQGFLMFENLLLGNDTLLQTINGISIDNLILKKCTHLQMVGEKKVVDGKLIFNGPAAVLNLNGHNLQEMYKQSIFTIENYHFDNLTIDEGTFVRGLVLVTGMSEGDEKERAMGEQKHDEIRNETNVTTYSAQLTAAIEELSTLLNTENRSTPHLLYLDYDLNIEILMQYANESVRDTYLYELERISMCEKRVLQLQTAENNRRLFITKLTTNLLTARAGVLSVKVQNFCGEQGKKKVKSKITVNGRRVTKVFGMKKYIESLTLFTAASNYTFLLLHAIDEARQRNEVRVMRIIDENNNIREWQTLQFGFGKTMNLFKIDNMTALLSYAVVNNQPALTIYHFNVTTQQFKLAQVIDGAYDVMELVAVAPQHYQLLLSCHKCHHLHVYDFSTDASHNSYKLLQIIELPTLIDKLHAFTMHDGELFLLVLSEQQQDYFYLYRYAYVEGWKQSSVGYFPNIDLAVPLNMELMQTYGKYLLLLLCGGGAETQRCSVVSPYTQG
ncbi:uncharacterized protein fs(1)M3 [Eurosta solidaginis]|uniref:uncharacterized protein fs(1)M3 n=1 Tax=Eurosta solidaginis TaxID=178769 RepID=UPI003530AFF5